MNYFFTDKKFENALAQGKFYHQFWIKTYQTVIYSYMKASKKKTLTS